MGVTANLIPTRRAASATMRCTSRGCKLCRCKDTGHQQSTTTSWLAHRLAREVVAWNRGATPVTEKHWVTLKTEHGCLPAHILAWLKRVLSQYMTECEQGELTRSPKVDILPSGTPTSEKDRASMRTIVVCSEAYPP